MASVTYNSDYQRRYRERNKERLSAYFRAYRNDGRRREYFELERDKRRAIVDEAHAGGCVDCGIKNPLVLDSDHVSGEKVANVSRMVINLSPIHILIAELEKCVTRCANCHRIVTANRRKVSV